MKTIKLTPEEIQNLQKSKFYYTHAVEDGKLIEVKIEVSN
jgi:hypothetical protein